MEPFERRAMQTVLGWDPVGDPESAAELLADYLKADFDAMSTESDGVEAEEVSADDGVASFKVRIAGQLLELVVRRPGARRAPLGRAPVDPFGLPEDLDV